MITLYNDVATAVDVLTYYWMQAKNSNCAFSDFEQSAKCCPQFWYHGYHL